MNSNDILELVRAGYTKEEINAMTETNKTEQKQEEKTETKTEEQKTEEQKTEEQKTEEKNEYKELSELVKNVTETVKAMQAYNAKKVSAETEKEITSESAIKSFFEDIPKK